MIPARITVKIVPNSKQDKICGFLEEDILKIKIKAKPIDGKANKHLINFLSKVLGVPKKNISIKKGKKSRLKLIEIKEISRQEIIGRIKDL